MFDWLPTEGMWWGGIVTALLLLALIVIMLRAIEDREKMKADHVTMGLSAAKPYKPLHIKV